MAKTLEAHDKLICEIFQGGYQFEIPDYQRPYAWTVEQAEELFNDLIAAMQDARTHSSTGQYFLGSIVLIKTDRELKALVVDGQQRLTTLTILFSVLRAAWEAASYPQGVKSVTPFLYEEGDEMLGKATGYRFTAREEDAVFFRQYIQEPGGIEQLVRNTDKLEDSCLRYRENAALLLTRVTNLSAEERNALWKFVANDCSLVVISTPDLEAAYRIFSVLNNRGLDLAPIDIIKADVLGLIRGTAGEAQARAYAKKWSEIELLLGRNAFGDLFGHIRSIYAQKKQKHTLVKEFQEYVTEYRTPLALIDHVIRPYAEVWGFVRDTNFESTEYAEQINDYLSWLNRIDFKDWVPPALVYFKRFRQKPKLLAEFFASLERLSYFLLLTKVAINGRIDTYAALIKDMQAPAFSGDPATLNSLALTAQQKREFVNALNGDIYNHLPKARMALVLRLESLLRAPGVQLQDAVSLEHVLPQTPAAGSDWYQWFSNESDRDTWTHRLANLVLLDRKKNSSASNYAFAHKKKVYFKGQGTASPFMLTQEVRSESQWTPELLAERQQRLVGILKKHWQLTADHAHTPGTVVK